MSRRSLRPPLAPRLRAHLDLRLYLALFCLVLAAAGGKAPPLNQNAPISFTSTRLEMDVPAQRAVLRENVVVTQGDLRVTADRADVTGFNRPNSRWTLTGNVHLTSELRGKLQSDEAVIEIRDSQVQSVVATGHPAQFEQTSSTTGILARGHADMIEYMVAADTVRLTMDAFLKYGDNQQMAAPEVVYDIRAQKIMAAGTGRPGERVHITTVPRKGLAAPSKTGSAPGSKP